ncbi:MAG: 5-oxoprolinase subunit PxpA [Gemmataceae bacterium]
MQVDLNCDLGEGSGSDADLLPLVTTANIACGFHAGDPATAFATAAAAFQLGVRIGAHPSFPDRVHFGRRDLDRSEREIYEDCVFQVGSLDAVARACGTRLSHVKAHGALYNLACRDAHFAKPVVSAAALFGLPVFGRPASELEAACRDRCQFVPEGFADRRYKPDGSLVPRSEPHSLIDDPHEAAAQALRLVRDGGVRTLCVHGDTPGAVAFARALRTALVTAGFDVRSFA